MCSFPLGVLLFKIVSYLGFLQDSNSHVCNMMRELHTQTQRLDLCMLRTFEAIDEMREYLGVQTTELFDRIYNVQQVITRGGTSPRRDMIDRAPSGIFKQLDTNTPTLSNVYLLCYVTQIHSHCHTIFIVMCIRSDNISMSCAISMQIFVCVMHCRYSPSCQQYHCVLYHINVNICMCNLLQIVSIMSALFLCIAQYQCKYLYV